MQVNNLLRKTPLPRYLTIIHRGVPIRPKIFQKAKTVDHFIMLDTKEKEVVGYMTTRVTKNINHHEVYPYVKDCDSLYIEELFIYQNQRQKGNGSRFIKLAQTESKNQNCKGRIHLIASPMFDLINPPHIFYRKKRIYDD